MIKCIECYELLNIVRDSKRATLQKAQIIKRMDFNYFSCSLFLGREERV